MHKAKLLAICGVALILSVKSSFALGPDAACKVESEANFVSTLGLEALKVPDTMEQPILKSTCTIERTCDYPPPASVSCTGPTGNCSSGADGYAPYGWVQCGSGKIYCAPPPSCTASCISTVQCYSICSSGGVEPTTYQCLPSHHCCDCKY
jgi:hypothetical protein